MEVRAGEALGRNDQSRSIIQLGEPGQEAPCQLPDSVAYDPDFTEMGASRPECVITRRSGNPNMPFLHGSYWNGLVAGSRPGSERSLSDRAGASTGHGIPIAGSSQAMPRSSAASNSFETL